MSWFFQTAYAQQISSWSSYYETGFIWNPALTAKWNAVETSITHRKSWVGFDDSPEYSTFSYQYPFISRTHKRSSAGIYLDQDKVGPYKKLNLAATYAYGFSPRFRGKRDDVFTMGIKVNVSRFEYDPSKLVSFDEVEDNTILPLVSGASNISPNLGFGFFYNSVSDFWAYQKSHYYAGLSFNQIVPIKSVTLAYEESDFLPLGDLVLKPHATLHLGYRHIPFRAKYYLEPNVMLIYGFKKVVHAMANFRIERMNKYWGATGIATNGEVFLQAGVILNKNSVIGSIVKEGALRIGAKMDYHLGNFGKYAGVGYEFYAAYIWEVE